MQFTASEEFVKLVEEARALLSHSAPRATLDEIQLRAMRALVTELKRQKYSLPRHAGAKPGRQHSEANLDRPQSNREPRPRSHADPDRPPSDTEPAQPSQLESEHPRQRGRHVPAAVRRAVFQRDGGRCTYTDDSGRRCAETHLVELHHARAFARGGAHTEENLTLRCHAHNALAAEEEFGRELVELVRDTSEHESWAVCRRALTD